MNLKQFFSKEGYDISEKLSWDKHTNLWESWYKGKPVAKTYTIRDKVWNAYQYTDGELYVRGQSSPYAHNSSNATYKDGTAIKSSGTTCWFKVEPIKWFVINRSGNNYELFSELVLTGNIYFNASEDDENIWETSYIRSWCNNEFYNMAFTDSEKQHIVKTTIGNNVTGGSWPNATDDTTGKATQDNIYLMSHNEVGKTPFSGGETNAGSASRICCASDFAFSNASWYNKSSTSTSFYRSGEQITTAHWLRSAGEWEGAACYVSGGNRFIDGTVSSIDCGVRPALHVVV